MGGWWEEDVGACDLVAGWREGMLGGGKGDALLAVHRFWCVGANFQFVVFFEPVQGDWIGTSG